MGHLDASLTGEGADAGIDVNSTGAVAQVKAQTQPTGRPDVQKLAGVASVEGKAGYFFSIGGFTDEAYEWAARANIALFSFDLTGEPAPLNQGAEDVVARNRIPDERALEYARDLLDDLNDTVKSIDDLELRLRWAEEFAPHAFDGTASNLGSRIDSYYRLLGDLNYVATYESVVQDGEMPLDDAVDKMREKEGTPGYEGNRPFLDYYDKFPPLSTLRESLPDFVIKSIQEWSE